MKIPVIYDATILTSVIDKNSNRSGIFFAAYNIARELNNNKNVALSFYCEPASLNVLESAIKIHMPEFINVPFNNLDGNFLPNTCFLSPVFKVPDALENKGDIRKYTILYDTMPFSFPQYYPSIVNENVWIWRLRKLMARSPRDKYFSISLCTKKDWMKLVPELKSRQIIVTPLACADSFHPCSKEQTDIVLRKYGVPTDKKYVFSLCTLEPRKNLVRAVKTFIEFIKRNNINDMVFVLGGGHWDLFIDKLESEISDLGQYKDKIIRAGYIDDEDLAAFYSGALFFVYTSQYEGFGLPPLEAMACGTPVVSSNNSSLPEVVGDAAIKIKWDNDEQHIKAYEKYYFNENFRKSMTEEGLEHAKDFSWKKTVQIMVNEFKKSGDVKTMLREILGIKTTVHKDYYRCYFLWLPYIKVKYFRDLTKVYLFGIQIAQVKTKIQPLAPVVKEVIKEVVITKDNREVINQRAMEIIAKHQDSDYTKEAK